MASKLSWAALGVAAAAVAVGVGEIVAGVLGATSIVAGVGALIISLQPPGGKDLMVELFGTNDKLVLEIGVFAGAMFAGAVLGLLARRDRRIAYAGFVAFGLVGVRPDPPGSPRGSDCGVADRRQCRDRRPGDARLAGADAGWQARDGQGGCDSRVDAAPRLPGHCRDFRRRRWRARRGRPLHRQPGTADRPAARRVDALPDTAADSRRAPTSGSTGLSPIVVPNDDFYRIDTRLTIPHIQPANWNVRIFGMVDREVTLTYDDLVAMPTMERYVTIACVSNEVGGRLVGNAKWTGVSLNSVLDMAGVQQGATQVVGRSYDGWTSGFPTQHLSGAGQDAMIVLKMNGETLPAPHGFPARLIVPGLYGFVSATKWLTEIELTTLEAFDAYWVPLGWAKQAPILTQSRIDLPRSGGVSAGQVQVGGVAWAPTRGISKVEVALENGNWQECELSVPLSDYSWVQWRAMVDVPAGNHQLQVRATDGTGMTQSAERTLARARRRPRLPHGQHQRLVGAFAPGFLIRKPSPSLRLDDPRFRVIRERP